MTAVCRLSSLCSFSSFCIITLTSLCLNIRASELTSNIVSVSTCSCLGQTLTFKCTAIGGIFTVWSGSAFMCQGGEIPLQHNRFPLQAVGSCNDGAIIGQSVAVENNCYKSHLNLTLSSALVGRSVSCFVDDGSSQTSIGTVVLTINTTNTFLPPRNINIESIGPAEITFNWSTVLHDGCPSFRHNITAVNCGTCFPSETTSNMSVCTSFNTNNVCNFSVSSVICGELEGDVTYKLFNLKVPDVPLVTSIPRYSYGRQSSLIGIETYFSIVDSFNISDDPLVDGSALNYTIEYYSNSDLDSDTGELCDSLTIMASSCLAGTCKHILDTSSSSCSPATQITMTVLATNVLGSSNSSIPINIAGVNTFVNVTFIASTKRFHCQFLRSSPANSIQQCTVNVTYGSNCDKPLGMYTNMSSSNFVPTPPLDFIDSASEYCISVAATSDNGIVIVEGILNLFNTGQQNVNNNNVISGIVVILVFIIVAGVVVLVLGYFHCRKSRGDSEESKILDFYKEYTEHGYTVKKFKETWDKLKSGESNEDEIAILIGPLCNVSVIEESTQQVVYEIQQEIVGYRGQLKLIADNCSSLYYNLDGTEIVHSKVKVGDIVRVKGFPKRTDDGELCLMVCSLTVLLSLPSDTLSAIAEEDDNEDESDRTQFDKRKLSVLSLALGQQDSEFEHDHTLKEFSTWENESIKLAGRICNKREEPRKLIVYEIRHIDGDKVQLTAVNDKSIRFCEDDFESVRTNIHVGDILALLKQKC